MADKQSFNSLLRLGLLATPQKLGPKERPGTWRFNSLLRLGLLATVRGYYGVPSMLQFQFALATGVACNPDQLGRLAQGTYVSIRSCDWGCLQQKED